jgi:hypothetical protein
VIKATLLTQLLFIPIRGADCGRDLDSLKAPSYSQGGCSEAGFLSVWGDPRRRPLVSSEPCPPLFPIP